MSHWLNNRSLRAKVLGAFIFVVIIGVLSLGWDAFSLVTIDSKASDISQESDQLMNVQSIQAYVLEEDLDGKNILLTGDTSWLDEHEADRQDTDRYIKETAAAASDPQDTQALNEIVTLRDQYEQKWKQVLDAYQSGDESAAADAAFDKSDTQMQDIHDRLDGIVTRGQDYVDALYAEATQQSQMAVMLSAIGIVLFLVTGAVVVMAVNQTVTAIQSVTRAAGAVEAGHYDQLDLGSLVDRSDDVGQLARVFKHMADEVYAREQKLKEQVEELHIQIDLVKQDQQVKGIVDSDFFKDLKARAQNIRSERQKSGGADKPAES